MNYLALVKAVLSTFLVIAAFVLLVYLGVNYALQLLAIIFCLLMLGILAIIGLAFYEEYKK